MRKRLRQLFLLFTAFIVLASCASMGKADLNLAREALENNRPSAALLHASEALLEDPEFDDAKEFLREESDSALARIQSFLDQSGSSRERAVVEKRFDTYRNLVKFYTNLENIGLPLVKGKKLFGLIKGWEWSTPIIDYSSQLSQARAAARDVFLEDGYAALQKGELDSSKALLRKAVGKFAVEDSDEQKQDKQEISRSYSDWAAAYHGSKDVDALLKGLKAYRLALSFSKENEVAEEGRTRIRVEISDRYLAMAAAEEEKNTVDALKEAIEFYKKARSYNSANDAAEKGIQRSRHKIAVIFNNRGTALVERGGLENLIEAFENYEKALTWDSEFSEAEENRESVRLAIAEYYYQDARSYERNLGDADALRSAMAAYDSAMEWVSEYKDSGVRKKRLKVAYQVVLLEEKLGETISEYERTRRRIVLLSEQVSKGHQGIEDLFYVSDKIVQLDGQMKAIKTAISPLSGIPVVGTVFTATGTVLNRSHRPVNRASKKVKKVQKPYITPSRELIGKVKSQTDLIVSSMTDIYSSLMYVQRIVQGLNGCVQNLDDQDTLREVERDAKRINSVLDDLNEGLDTVNASQDRVEGTMSDLADSVSVISDVSGGVRSIMRPLDKISSVTDEINNVLKKRIKIPLVGSFTVEEAINSTTGVVKKAAEKLLNPLLDELNINLPAVPGIEELNRILDDVEGYYEDIKAAETEISRAAEKIVDVPGRLREAADSIVQRTGCSL